MNDVFGQEVTVGARVAVCRMVGYSVEQYAGTVLEVYLDKYGDKLVHLKYDQPTDGSYSGIPKRPQRIRLDKVVVINVQGGSPD